MQLSCLTLNYLITVTAVRLAEGRDDFLEFIHLPMKINGASVNLDLKKNYSSTDVNMAMEEEISFCVFFFFPK